jgi:hypothetical protein
MEEEEPSSLQTDQVNLLDLTAIGHSLELSELWSVKAKRRRISVKDVDSPLRRNALD